jgi:hypothetical protein
MAGLSSASSMNEEAQSMITPVDIARLEEITSKTGTADMSQFGAIRNDLSALDHCFEAVVANKPEKKVKTIARYAM